MKRGYVILHSSLPRALVLCRLGKHGAFAIERGPHGATEGVLEWAFAIKGRSAYVCRLDSGSSNRNDSALA